MGTAELQVASPTSLHLQPRSEVARLNGTRPLTGAERRIAAHWKSDEEILKRLSLILPLCERAFAIVSSLSQNFPTSSSSHTFNTSKSHAITKRYQ